MVAQREIEKRKNRLLESGPHCPKCHDPMKKITMHKTGFEFWGCTNYPSCTGRRSGKSGDRYEP